MSFPCCHSLSTLVATSTALGWCRLLARLRVMLWRRVGEWAVLSLCAMRDSML